MHLPLGANIVNDIDKFKRNAGAHGLEASPLVTIKNMIVNGAKDEND